MKYLTSTIFQRVPSRNVFLESRDNTPEIPFESGNLEPKDPSKNIKKNVKNAQNFRAQGDAEQERNAEMI